MNARQRINPEAILRLGLGLMYLYSGFDLIRHPTAWWWALPFWLKQIIESVVALNTYLKFQGVAEILIAVIFLGWFLPRSIVKIGALFSSLEMAAILVLAFTPFSEANFLITFRDIGLLGASLALLVLLQKENGTG
ncbi:hypothetical protein HYV91_02900 [Candidatus Wolfebacteria bacterium]|nr:hypothetical protein [Candidatus Wolfebacteria bacterium]